MPDILSLSAVARLKKRAKTIARVTGISPIAAHDQVAREAGYKNWAQLSKTGTRTKARSFTFDATLLKISKLMGHRSTSTTLRFLELKGAGRGRGGRPAAKLK